MRFNICFVCNAPAKIWARDPWHPEMELGFCSEEHYRQQASMWKAGQDLENGTGDPEEALHRLKNPTWFRRD